MAIVQSLQFTAPTSAVSLSTDSPTRASSWINSSLSPKHPKGLSLKNEKSRSKNSSNLSASSKNNFRHTVVSQAYQNAVVDIPSTSVTIDDVVTSDLYYSGDRLLEILGDANIYLIGMMGCGKTTVGKILSESLGYYFFDSDTVVEQTVGTSVADIFSKHGEATFRDLETQAIQNLSSMNKLIVATGGGAIIRPENWKCMKNGIVVWLDVPLTDLASRVVKAGVRSRPLVDSHGDNEDQYSAALNKLSTIFEKRHHLYPQADLQLSFTDIAHKYGTGSVASVTPNMIALELIRGVTRVLETRHLNDAYCPLDSSWIDEEIYIPVPMSQQESRINAVV